MGNDFREGARLTWGGVVAGAADATGFQNEGIAAERREYGTVSDAFE